MDKHWATKWFYRQAYMSYLMVTCLVLYLVTTASLCLLYVCFSLLVYWT